MFRSSSEVLEMLEGFFVAVLEADDERQEFCLGDVGERLFDVIGQALRDRAEVGVYVGLIARHVAEVGKEHVVGALVETVLDCAVGDFRGEAIGAFCARDSFVGNFGGEDGLDAELVEEP